MSILKKFKSKGAVVKSRIVNYTVTLQLVNARSSWHLSRSGVGEWSGRVGSNLEL